MIKMRRKGRLHGLAHMCFGKADGDGDGWAEIMARRHFMCKK